MRLGIYGGSFDPVHLGHLVLAETCREVRQLDRVWFLPAASPPHKTGRALTPAEQRLEMLELAIGGHSAFEICRREIDRGGVSYTVETLAELARDRSSEDELFLLLGTDMARDLPNWKDPVQILELASPIVASRPPDADIAWDAWSHLLSTDCLNSARGMAVRMPLLEISSQDLRQRVAEGRSIRYLTPRAVEKYIQAVGLYLKTDDT